MQKRIEYICNLLERKFGVFLRGIMISLAVEL